MVVEGVQRVALASLGDPHIMCVTNTKGEVWFYVGSCIALSIRLDGHLALTAREDEALSMLRMACSMHLSSTLFWDATPLYPTGPNNRSEKWNALLYPSNYYKIHHRLE